jgi:hypothetical protein
MKCKESSDRIAGVAAEIKTENLPKTKLKRYLTTTSSPRILLADTVEAGYTAGIWGHHEHPRYKLTLL